MLVLQTQPPVGPRPSVSYVADQRRKSAAGPPSGTFGIALSGGGTRSLSCSSGFLRGLKAVGVLDNASHISGVSGGGWATAGYTYAQGIPQEKVLLMDRAGLQPQSLTLEFVDTLPPAESLLRGATILVKQVRWIPAVPSAPHRESNTRERTRHGPTAHSLATCSPQMGASEVASELTEEDVNRGHWPCPG